MRHGSLITLALLLSPGASWLGSAAERSPAADWRASRYLSPGGADAGDCSSPLDPCASLAYCVTQVAAGDVIRLARGTYLGGAALDGVPSPLAIEGGWSADFSWRSDNPSLTVIDGGGITFESCDPLDLHLEGLTITNAAAGVSLTTDCAPDGGRAFGPPSRQTVRTLSIDRCVVRGNVDGVVVRGDYCCAGPSATLTNAQVVDNTGGGVWIVAGYADIDLTMTASTVAGNLLGGLLLGAFGGSTFGLGETTGTVADSVVWGNAEPDVQLYGSYWGLVTLTASYSDFGLLTIGGSFGGTYHEGPGMTSTDPGFGPGAGPRRLVPGSPCVDTGTDDGAPTVDFEGDARPADGDGDGTAVTDVGADELPPGALFLDGFEAGDTVAWTGAAPRRRS